MEKITAQTINVTTNKSDNARACGDAGLRTGLMTANQFIL
jgi:hypothetical protein